MPHPLVSQFAPHERTVPAMLSRQAERFGDAPLVGAGGATWTFAQTRDEASAFAGTLKMAGIAQGDRVALIASNRLDFLRVFLGCAWLGAVCVPVNTASRGAQLQHILSNCGARLLILEPVFAANLNHLDMAALAVETIWTIDAEAPLRSGKITSAPVPASADRPRIARLRPLTRVPVSC